MLDELLVVRNDDQLQVALALAGLATLKLR